MKFIIFFLLLSLSFISHSEVRLKSIARLAGLQENPLTGYGLVIGLSGSGDSRRNRDTTQAIVNLLTSFGVNINLNDINSRNTATVIVTTNLPYYTHQGDKLDINVASLGDAKSLLGGTLLITPLKGTNNEIYALAQGPLSVGGFKYDLFGNMIQKNHPTAGIVSGGAVVQKTLYNDLISKTGELHLIVNRPDFTTAEKIESVVNRSFGENTAKAHSAQDIEIHPPASFKNHLIQFISQLENLPVIPDNLPVVVVNERTGVVIAGAEVKMDAVTISCGNLQIAITSDYLTSQPTMVAEVSDSIKTTVVPQTSIHVKENKPQLINLTKGATVADLIGALSAYHTPTRDIISILESLKTAGALHADLVIQ